MVGNTDKRSGYIVIDSSLEITIILTILLISASSILPIPLKITIFGVFVGMLLSPLYIIALKSGSVVWGCMVGLCLGLLALYAEQYFINSNLSEWCVINVTLAIGVGITCVFSVFRKQLQEKIKKKSAGSLSS